MGKRERVERRERKRAMANLRIRLRGRGSVGGGWKLSHFGLKKLLDCEYMRALYRFKKYAQKFFKLAASLSNAIANIFNLCACVCVCERCP